MRCVPKLPNTHKCAGCLACGDVCPTECISFPLMGDGHFHPHIDKNKCVQCLSCERACPVLNMRKGLSERSQPYAVWSKDTKLRLKSSSGGVFGQIAKEFLSLGGYVAGATIEGLNVKHIIIHSVDELPLIQGSKYLQSETVGIYKAVRKLLDKKKKVLFSGTGCQVAAIYNVIPKKLWANLYTIDLICHGVPSRYDLNIYCRMQKKKIVRIDSFRDKMWKPGYAMTCTCDDGSKIRSDINYFFEAFNNNKTLRWACYECKFKTGLNRCSDITIGDFWGNKKYFAELPKGLSLCILHSEKGNQMLCNEGLYIDKATWAESIFKNKDYFLPTNYYKYHPLRWIYPYLVKYASNYFLSKYIANIKIDGCFYFPLRIVDSIFQHCNHKNVCKQITKMLWAVKNISE